MRGGGTENKESMPLLDVVRTQQTPGDAGLYTGNTNGNTNVYLSNEQQQQKQKQKQRVTKKMTTHNQYQQQQEATAGEESGALMPLSNQYEYEEYSSPQLGGNRIRLPTSSTRRDHVMMRSGGFTGRKLLRTAWPALCFCLCTAVHLAGTITALALLEDARVSRSSLRMILSVGEAVLGVLVLLYAWLLRVLHERHLRHGYLRVYRALRPWTAAPEQCVCFCAAMLLVMLDRDALGAGAAMVAIQDAACALITGSYAYYVFAENAAMRPPDAMQELRGALRGYGAAGTSAATTAAAGGGGGGGDGRTNLSGGVGGYGSGDTSGARRGGNRGTLHDIAVWQQDTIAHLCRELLKLQAIRDVHANGDGIGRTSSSFARVPSSSSVGVAGDGTDAPGNGIVSHDLDASTAAGTGGGGGGGGAKGGGGDIGNVWSVSPDEERGMMSDSGFTTTSPTAVTETLAAALRDARRHVAESDAEVQRLRGVEAAHIAENARLRAMLNEWSARSAKLEQRLAARQEG